MIFPWPRLFTQRFEINLVNIIILANVLLFGIFFMESENEKAKSKLFNTSYSDQTVNYYYKYLQENSELKQNKEILLQYDFKNSNHRSLVSSTALRDKNFISSLNYQVWDNDEIRWNHWKSLVIRYQDEIKDQTLFILGLSHGNKQSLSWITYQFSHMNEWHLFSNMIFLFLLDIALRNNLNHTKYT